MRTCHCGGKLYKVFGQFELFDVKVPCRSEICSVCGEGVLSQMNRNILDGDIIFAYRDLVQKMKCCNNCKFSHKSANSGDSYCELKDEWTHEKCEKWEIY